MSREFTRWSRALTRWYPAGASAPDLVLQPEAGVHDRPVVAFFLDVRGLEPDVPQAGPLVDDRFLHKDSVVPYEPGPQHRQVADRHHEPQADRAQGGGFREPGPVRPRRSSRSCVAVRRLSPRSCQHQVRPLLRHLRTLPGSANPLLIRHRDHAAGLGPHGRGLIVVASVAQVLEPLWRGDMVRILIDYKGSAEQADRPPQSSVRGDRVSPGTQTAYRFLNENVFATETRSILWYSGLFRIPARRSRAVLQRAVGHEEISRTL